MLRDVKSIPPFSCVSIQFEEVYSIVSVVKDVTVYCQTTSEATAEGGMQRVFLLLTDTLEPTKDLKVRHVPVIGRGEAPSHTLRPHDDLTETGRNTREAFNTALAKRFLPRYGAGLRSRGHLFDHAMLLSPTMRKLKYIDVLLSSSAGQAAGLASPSEVKGRIKGEVVDLITKAVIEKRARANAEVAGAVARGARAGAETSTGQRSKTPQAAAAASANATRLRNAGIFDGSDDSDVDAASPRERAPEEEAKAELNDWLQLKVQISCVHCC